MKLNPENFATPAVEFINAEFIPTLVGLVTAALREPMSWGVIAVVVLAQVWRRARAVR